jgi:hypothetical protein
MTYYLGTCKKDDGGIFVVTVVILLVILAVLGIILQRTYFEYIYFEKMYEEILLDKQRHTSTKHDKIYIEQPINDSEKLLEEIHTLREGLSCEIPLYDDMIKWFQTEIVTK